MIVTVRLVFLSISDLAWGFTNYDDNPDLKADQVSYRY